MLGITNVSNAPSVVLKNTVVSSWTSDSYNGYSYRGAIPIVGVTANTIAEVTFSQAQAESGNYSSVCTTYDGGLYVYSKVNTQITIPSIIIHSIVETYYEMENSPVSGSTKAVTSGGVYNALLNPETVDMTSQLPSSNKVGGSMNLTKIGRIAILTLWGVSYSTSGFKNIDTSGWATKYKPNDVNIGGTITSSDPSPNYNGLLYTVGSNLIQFYIPQINTGFYGQFVYITQE